MASGQRCWMGRIGWRALGGAGAFAALALMGCRGAIYERGEAALRTSISRTIERELAEAERRDAGAGMTSRESKADGLEIREDLLEQIEQQYDPNGYFLAEDESELEGGERRLAQVDGLLGTDLYGRDQRAVTIGLQRVVSRAVEANLAAQQARLSPAISEADVVAAEAFFDWTFFSNLTWTDRDQPQAGPGFLNLPAVVQSDQVINSQTGLRRQLDTGGALTLQQDLIYTDERANAFGVLPTPNPASTTQFTVGLDQPLLRGFGSDVALSELRLARNQERRSIADLHVTLMDVVTDAENAYWDLVLAHRELVISAQLLERGKSIRDAVKARRILDAVQAQVADAIATVEERRGDVIRAQRLLRRASDQLKAIMNDPTLPVGSEVLLVPADDALDQPIEFSLLDSIQTAVNARPEIDQAVLDIDDASIRATVAENAVLPQFDLRAEVALLGFDTNMNEAFGRQFSGEFFDNFTLAALFEQPLGNRAAEAGSRRARLQRMLGVVGYRRQVQQVVLEVKTALDDVLTNYRLIEQARTSRLAAAEALRSLLEEKELTAGGYTVERLDLEFSQQERLGATERSEVAALLDYNRSVAALHRAQGTTLERNRIEFVVPDVNQVLDGNLAIDYKVDGVAADAETEPESDAP